MSAKWIGFLVFVYVVAMIIGSIPTGEVLATNSTVTSPVQGVMSYVEVWSEQDWGTLVSLSTHLNFFRNIFQMLILDFPLFGGINSPWQIVRWLVMGPVIGTIIFGLIILFVSIFRRTV